MVSVITKAEARASGVLRYFTGQPCANGHVDARHVSTGACMSCSRDKQRRHIERWGEQYLKSRHDYYVANKGRQLDLGRRWRTNNPERSREITRASLARIGPARRNAYTASRRFARAQATPPWIDQRDIAAVYVECARITAETGIEHQVDHHYPLKGKTSCGLHVPWNLRILTKAANLSKGSKEPGGVPL